MDEATLTLAIIYLVSYTFGLAPFTIFVFIIRRYKLKRLTRALACSAVAAITATPVAFALGWFAAFIPVSLGLILGPSILSWTFNSIIPATPIFHAISLAVTLVVGFSVGWIVRPKVVAFGI